MNKSKRRATKQRISVKLGLLSILMMIDGCSSQDILQGAGKFDSDQYKNPLTGQMESHFTEDAWEFIHPIQS